MRAPVLEAADATVRAEPEIMFGKVLDKIAD